MSATKLISIRVPDELLRLIDKDAGDQNYNSRSSIIVNMLQAIYDAADEPTKFIMSTWAFRKSKGYTLTFSFTPTSSVPDELGSKNLITP